MAIREVYIVHHSHTDVGYTDLQEQVIYNQVNNIREVVRLLSGAETGGVPGLAWNCETAYCVEKFLQSAQPQEKKAFFDLVRAGRIGLSANWLNFTELADCGMARRRLASFAQELEREGIKMRTAMFADINGISLGMRDALMENGVEFLYTNIHTHHGMYPLYRNQTPFFWENEAGQRLLVWNGEHYNLGNALGIVFNKNVNFMTESYFGKKTDSAPLERLYANLRASIAEYEKSGYPYDFYITSVSGVFSDNAPVNPAIAQTVRDFNERWGGELTLRMVTLDELYGLIREKTAQAPVYRGAMNDWWGNGVGSTPYAVKHYKEALRLSHLCDCLEEKTGVRDEALVKEETENALLYAEHTWGHSATATNPFDTMVTNLDLRKTSYASRAHEAAAMRRSRQYHLLGDILRYYNLNGRVRAVSTSRERRKLPVEFYVETMAMTGVAVTEEKTGRSVTAQLSPHPRGVLVSFVDEFGPLEEKTYVYKEVPVAPETLYTRTAWVGAERVRDIVNDYDTESYRLPYGMENEWFSVRWRVGEGVTSFYGKKEKRELLTAGTVPFFTPIYERTEIRRGVYEERRLLGRNIRGLHAQLYPGALRDVRLLERGEVFLRAELEFALEGARHCSVVLKMYRHLPRIEFTLKLAKEMREDIESVYLPLTLAASGRELWLHNGGAAYRPGIDQLPGTNKEYYMADEGLLYQEEKSAFAVSTLDTPLLYMGELRHHPIELCGGSAADNARPVYSWIMNNTWETNFKMDLSGYGEFRYAVERLEGGDVRENLRRLQENDMGTAAFICG